MNSSLTHTHILMMKDGGIQVFMEEVEKIDPMVKLPDDYIMASRLSLLLRMNALVGFKL